MLEVVLASVRRARDGRTRSPLRRRRRRAADSVLAAATGVCRCARCLRWSAGVLSYLSLPATPVVGEVMRAFWQMRLQNAALVFLVGAKLLARGLNSLLFCASEATREATHHPAAARGRLKKSRRSKGALQSRESPRVTCSENRARPARGPLLSRRAEPR